MGIATVNLAAFDSDFAPPFKQRNIKTHAAIMHPATSKENPLITPSFRAERISLKKNPLISVSVSAGAVRQSGTAVTAVAIIQPASPA